MRTQARRQSFLRFLQVRHERSSSGQTERGTGRDREGRNYWEMIFRLTGVCRWRVGGRQEGVITEVVLH